VRLPSKCNTSIRRCGTFRIGSCLDDNPDDDSLPDAGNPHTDKSENYSGTMFMEDCSRMDQDPSIKKIIPVIQDRVLFCNL
jgi:hypothetical protein